jgi:hypothetical protein
MRLLGRRLVEMVHCPETYFDFELRPFPTERPRLFPPHNHGSCQPAPALLKVLDLARDEISPAIYNHRPWETEFFVLKPSGQSTINDIEMLANRSGGR